VSWNFVFYSKTTSYELLCNIGFLSFERFWNKFRKTVDFWVFELFMVARTIQNCAQ